jgi:DNA-binding transcriptional regulator LsrR (DeoR family)
MTAQPATAQARIAQQTTAQSTSFLVPALAQAAQMQT